MNIVFLLVAGVLALLLLAAITLSRRSLIACVTASVFALGIAAFCAFGFLASFELSDSPLSRWHLAYAILGIGSMITAFLGLRGARKMKAQRKS